MSDIRDQAEYQRAWSSAFLSELDPQVAATVELLTSTISGLRSGCDELVDALADIDRLEDEVDVVTKERDALTARVAQLEACLTDVKEQLEMRGIRE